jgi:hypothetical protein
VAGLRNGITGHCARGHLAWIPGGGSFLRRNHLVFWQTDSNDKCVHLPFGWINAIKMLGNWVRSKGSSTHLRLGGVFAFALALSCHLFPAWAGGIFGIDAWYNVCELMKS